MSLDNSQRLLFRDAMATLSAAVNIVTTDGDAGPRRAARHCSLLCHGYAADPAGVHQPQQCAQ